MDNSSEKVLLNQKLDGWIAYGILIAVATLVGYLMAQHWMIGMGLIGVILALTVAFICIVNTEAGLYINMGYSFFISHFNRLLFNDMLPVGLFSDLLILTTFLGFFVRQESLRKNINEFANSNVAKIFLFLYLYIALELFNPYANFFYGWFPAFRKILGTFLLLFISFNIFNSLSRIKRFISVLFVMCTIVGIYGCIQEWHGFFSFETEWLNSDKTRFVLTFTFPGGRKMSTMDGAPSFAIVMSACSVFFIGIALGQKKIYKKFILGIGVIFMLLGMTFAIIRTANAMFVAGSFILLILTLDKLITRLIAIPVVLLFLLLMYGPFENAQTDQFRQTFARSQNDSHNVRDENRKLIQPYLYAHPIGGGLGTTGDEGVVFNPGHPLAGFPPDSGSLKKALEMGWIGFGIITILYFLILQTGIRGYFTSRNEEVKFIYAAITAACFCLYVGDFTQVAIGQLTDIVVYYPFIAIMLKLKTLDHPTKI